MNRKWAVKVVKPRNKLQIWPKKRINKKIILKHWIKKNKQKKNKG